MVRGGGGSHRWKKGELRDAAIIELVVLARSQLTDKADSQAEKFWKVSGSVNMLGNWFLRSRRARKRGMRMRS